MSYRLVRRLRGFLFWLAVLAFLLWLGLSHLVPVWVPIGLAIAWLIALLYGIAHVSLTRRTGWRCPSCDWAPYAIDAWKCKGCGQRLDVFSSLGVCGRCGHRHEEAVCLRCRQQAPTQTWIKPV